MFLPKFSSFFLAKIVTFFDRKLNFIYRKNFQNFKSRTHAEGFMKITVSKILKNLKSTQLQTAV